MNSPEEKPESKNSTCAGSSKQQKRRKREIAESDRIPDKASEVAGDESENFTENILIEISELDRRMRGPMFESWLQLHRKMLQLKILLEQDISLYEKIQVMRSNIGIEDQGGQEQDLFTT